MRQSTDIMLFGEKMKKTLCFIAFCSFIAASCQKVHEKFIPQTSAVETGQELEKKKDTEMFPERIKVPPNFPKDVYVYNGGKIVSASCEEDVAQVEIITSRNPKELLKEMKDKMIALEWEIDKDLAAVYGDQDKLFLKKNGRNASYSASEYEGEKINLLLEVRNAGE